MEWKKKIFSNVVDATVIVNEKNKLEMAGNEVIVTYDRYFDRWEMDYRKKGDNK